MSVTSRHKAVGLFSGPLSRQQEVTSFRFHPRLVRFVSFLKTRDLLIHPSNPSSLHASLTLPQVLERGPRVPVVFAVAPGGFVTLCEVALRVAAAGEQCRPSTPVLFQKEDLGIKGRVSP